MIRLSDQEIKRTVMTEVAALNAALRIAADHGLTIEFNTETIRLIGSPECPQVAVLLTRVERV